MDDSSDAIPRRPSIWIAAIALVAAALPLVIIVVVLAYVGPTGFPMGPFAFAIGGPLLVVIPVMVFALRKSKWAVRGLVLSRERDGLVCPHCHGRPATSANEVACCRKAPRDWSEDDYRAWWQSMAKGDAHAVSLPTNDESRLHRWRPGIMTLTFGSLGLVTRVIPYSTWDVVTIIESCGPWILMGYGSDLGSRGFGGWRAGRVVCAACGYPRHAGTTAFRCSECGNDWTRRLGVKLERRKQPRLIAAGIAAMLLGLLFMVQVGFFGSAWLRRMQTTSGLIRAATDSSPGGFASRNGAWTELNRRQLSPAEQTRLFHAILDHRLRSLAVFGQPNLFVNAFLASGLATEADLRRLRVESFTPRLDHSAIAEVGEPITITVGGQRHEEFLPPAHGVAVYLGGAWFDGESAPSAGGRGHWTLEIHQGKDQPVVELRSSSAGKRAFTVRLWLVARRFGLLQNPIDWNSDGTPVLPPDGLWAEPVDVRGSIVVRPEAAPGTR